MVLNPMRELFLWKWKRSEKIFSPVKGAGSGVIISNDGTS